MTAVLGGEAGAVVTISVVMPTLDEAENLAHVLPLLPSWVDELVLVDGGSSDDTVGVARALRPSVRIVEERRPGKGTALQTGFAASRGDIVVTLDADGSMDPREMPALVGPLLAGADLVKGTRFVQGGGTADMTRLRKAGNWGLSRLVRVLFGGRYTDLCYGYAAFWRRVLPLLDGEAPGFEIETLMNVRALTHRLHVVEVPSFEAERIHGEGKLRTMADGWRVLRTILRERAALGVGHRHEVPGVTEPVPEGRGTTGPSVRPVPAVQGVGASATADWAEGDVLFVPGEPSGA